MTLGPALAALAIGDDFIFFQKPLRDLREYFLGKQEAGSALAPQAQIPAFGNFLGERKTLLLGRPRRCLPSIVAEH